MEGEAAVRCGGNGGGCGSGGWRGMQQSGVVVVAVNGVVAAARVRTPLDTVVNNVPRGGAGGWLPDRFLATQTDSWFHWLY